MKRFLRVLPLLGALLSASPADAVQVGATFLTSAPTSVEVANWNTGWGASGITGWDYVGTMNGASGVYLGNDWVLTAAHVGVGPFTLGANTYSVVAGSTVSIMNPSGLADLTLFRIDTTAMAAPNLPSLTLATTAPIVFSAEHPGDSVVMIGYGGGAGKSWGMNTITDKDILVSADGFPYTTVDFQTAYGTTTAGASSVTNDAQLVGGDSGGADFVYDSATGRWLLAGINEARDPETNDAYMVQLSEYAPQIKQTVPALPPSGVAASFFLIMGLAVRALPKKRAGSVSSVVS